MMMERSLVLITDTPTPYRVFSYSMLFEALAAESIQFRVIFMASRVSTRYATADPSESRFPFRIASGLHPRVGDEVFHFNPGALIEMALHPPTWVLLGGAWPMPTTSGILAVSRMRGRSKVILWLEANSDAIRYRDGLVSAARRLVWRSADAYAIPGKVARETVEAICGVTSKPFLPFPNLVDESRFCGEVAQLRANRSAIRAGLRIADDDRLFFWPARLNEPAKGVINFLSAIAPVLKPSTRIVIAGEGPDRPMIERWLRDRGLPQVTLLGQQSETQVIEWLAVADAVLLPSRRDPNPLSVIEALWASQPLLISSHCGNWPEALETGRNGWLVDPDDATSMRAAFAELQESPPGTLREFGARSRTIAARRFETRTAMQRFVAALPSVASPTAIVHDGG